MLPTAVFMLPPVGRSERFGNGWAALGKRSSEVPSEEPVRPGAFCGRVAADSPVFPDAPNAFPFSLPLTVTHTLKRWAPEVWDPQCARSWEPNVDSRIALFCRMSSMAPTTARPCSLPIWWRASTRSVCKLLMVRGPRTRTRPRWKCSQVRLG